MFNRLLTCWLRFLGGEPCFRIWGKARPENAWRVIDVFATSRRNFDSRWPLWRGTCITWTDRVIVVGCDFAERIVQEQRLQAATREQPLAVASGRLRDSQRRVAAGAPERVLAGEVLAHECGHTCQAIRLGWFYLPLVGAVTLFQEGPHFWNHFENQASEIGQFGGFI